MNEAGRSQVAPAILCCRFRSHAGMISRSRVSRADENDHSVPGQPIVRGTRILADTIVEDAELGSPLEEIQENYPDLSLTAIQELIAFAHSHRARRVP